MHQILGYNRLAWAVIPESDLCGPSHSELVQCCIEIPQTEGALRRRIRFLQVFGDPDLGSSSGFLSILRKGDSALSLERIAAYALRTQDSGFAYPIMLGALGLYIFITYSFVRHTSFAPRCGAVEPCVPTPQHMDALRKYSDGAHPTSLYSSVLLWSARSGGPRQAKYGKGGGSGFMRRGQRNRGEYDKFRITRRREVEGADMICIYTRMPYPLNQATRVGGGFPPKDDRSRLVYGSSEARSRRDKDKDIRGIRRNFRVEGILITPIDFLVYLPSSAAIAQLKEPRRTVVPPPHEKTLTEWGASASEAQIASLPPPRTPATSPATEARHRHEADRHAKGQGNQTRTGSLPRIYDAKNKKADGCEASASIGAIPSHVKDNKKLAVVLTI
ncbi:hypothetical protein DFP72DRAFT_861873 [Ephemerocybe angulata]|uniref:Uncharacterized protein n=1 Tax=Ephemerocybe angulata TaxID=980116 RepID=A0A8H6H8V5_9AGAR|nr:hypothetical protein DFP72DRAFT_861873 [Tulosesus angulatus]